MEQITELWRMFLRRFWMIAIIGVIGTLVAGFYAYIKPATYLAETKILVKSQQIPNELARSTVTESADERLRVIQQRLMSRNNLQSLIEELGLFAGRGDMTISDQVALLRAATRIRPVGVGKRNRNRQRDVALSAFTIQVSFDKARIAAKIANRFATIVLEQNLEARTRTASETLKYFNSEAERVSNELRALEQEMSAFKNLNQDALPESLAFRQAELARLAETKLNLEQRALELEEQRSTLLLALEADVQAAQSSPEEAELRQLKAELAQKSAVLSGSHREIRALRARIAALEGAIAEARGPGGESFQDKSIKHQIELIQEQISLGQRQTVELDKRRRELLASLQRTPNVELQLNTLDRRYVERQEMLAEINRKRAEAETGERLEVNRQAESFEVIEEAIIPEVPISPNRKKILIIGSGLSLVLALALAFLLDQVRPRIRSADQMERVLELRPVITVPYIRTRGERRMRMARFASLVLIVGAGIPAALYQIDQNYMPLELVAEKVAEKSGLDKIVRWTEARF